MHFYWVWWNPLMGMSCVLVQKCTYVTKSRVFPFTFAASFRKFHVLYVNLYICVSFFAYAVYSEAGSSSGKLMCECNFTFFFESRLWECRVLSFNMWWMIWMCRVFPFTFVPSPRTSQVLVVCLHIFVSLFCYAVHSVAGSSWGELMCACNFIVFCESRLWGISCVCVFSGVCWEV